MTKEMELLGKLELSEENRAKLLALLEEGKKSGKVSSKKLVETLDAVDATEEQTEQFYDVLEAAHVEIDVSRRARPDRHGGAGQPDARRNGGH